MEMQTKNLINSIISENFKSAQEEEKRKFEEKVVTLDGDSEEIKTEVKKTSSIQEVTADQEMKDDQKVSEAPKEESKAIEKESLKEESPENPESNDEKKEPKEEIKKEKSKWHAERPTEMQYIVKFKNQSYRKTRWINESDFFELYSFQCQQKLNRWKIKVKKDKANGVYVPPCDDEDKFFDRSFLQVCKVISCTNLFPVIHPRQAKNVSGTWREKCVNILQLICNFH